MAAVLFGLLAAVLQISGTFSFHSALEEHDSIARPWLNDHLPSRDYRKFGYDWKYRDFPDFHFDSRRRFTNNEQNQLDYQLFPSNWIPHKKDFGKFISQSRLSNALSSDSRTTSSRSRLHMAKHLKTLPKESRKEQYSDWLLKPRPVVLNTSSLRSSKGVNDGMNSPNSESSAVLYKNDVKHAGDSQDNKSINSALHTMVSIDDLTSEISTARSPTEDGERNEDDSIDNEAKSTKTDQEGNENGATEETTPVEEDSTHTASFDEESTDVTDATVPLALSTETTDASTRDTSTASTEITNQTLAEKEANETESDQDETEETKDVENETGKPTTEEISKNTPGNSSASEDTPSTKSQITSTQEVPGSSLEDTTETVDASSTSVLNETDLPLNGSTSEATDASSSDSNPSEATTLSTTNFPVSTKDVTDAPVSPTLSTKITDESTEDASSTFTESTFSKSEFVTETTSVAPEHVIDIPSIRKAKIVISVVFLVIGLIAVAILAVYMFRERRKAVKYDQLKLLP